MDDDSRNAAIEAYRRGALEEAGGYIGLQPVAIKYGHAFDETADAYAARLRAALGLPDWVPTPTDPGDQTDVAPTAEAPETNPAPEPEDNPEPEDEDDHPTHRRRHRR